MTIDYLEFTLDGMRKKKELPEVEPVKLRSVFGIRPGIIISAIIIAAIIAAFFIVCVLPGILSKGSYISFDINIPDVAIYQDGRYIGSSNGSVYYLESGKHAYSFSYKGIDCGELAYEVPHPVLFTLFHHRVDTISFDVAYSPEIEKKAKESFISDVAIWSRITGFDAVSNYPPLFSSFVKTADALGFSDIENELYLASMNITSKEMLSDFRSSIEGRALSGRLVRMDGLLSAVFGEEGGEAIAMGNDRTSPLSYADGFYCFGEGDVEIGRSTALSYPDAIYYPSVVHYDAFSIAEQCVSEYEYALFVKANPEWGKDSKDALIEKGLVDSSYLDGIVLSTTAGSPKPVRNISYYAAQAYCSWLSSETGDSYRLPTEAEWTAAALSTDGSFSSSLLLSDSPSAYPKGMLGQVWEFTSDSFIPLSRAASFNGSIPDEYDVFDIIVKGGSFINKDADVHSIGVFPRSYCSEYTGFRVVKEQ